MLRVLVRVHRPAEDHDRVVSLRRVERRRVVIEAKALEPISSLLDDVLEQAASARRGRLVDDGEDAHRGSVARRSEQRHLGGRQVDPAGRLEPCVVEQASEDDGAPRCEVVAVVVE